MAIQKGAHRISPYLGRVLDGDRAVGTCFQLEPGLIATAWHVLKGLGAEASGDEISLATLDPRVGKPFAASVKLFDPTHDLAVLQTAGDLGDSIGRLSPSDQIEPNSLLKVTGVGGLNDPEHTYPSLDAFGWSRGYVLRDEGVDLCRMISSEVLQGMSGAPVRLARDETIVVGVVSARYNSADGWFRDQVWIARTEDLEVLVEGLDTAITRPHLEQPSTIRLSTAEQLALGLILCDPMAFSRGAWSYPLQQDLTRRGLTSAQATMALGSLSRLGLVEYVDVPEVDDVTGEKRPAPAYRVTDQGLSVAQANPAISNFQDKYSYVLTVSGDEQSNKAFLKKLRSMPPVEAQTRFIVPEDGEIRIAAWSYEPLDGVVSPLATETGTSILRVRRT